MSEVRYKSHVGADKPDAELDRLTARAYRELGMGRDVEDVLCDLSENWREFARINNKKVYIAAKVSRGPYAGQSVIHYRWAFPDKVDMRVASIMQEYFEIMEGKEDE